MSVLKILIRNVAVILQHNIIYMQLSFAHSGGILAVLLQIHIVIMQQHCCNIITLQLL